MRSCFSNPVACGKRVVDSKFESGTLSGPHHLRLQAGQALPLRYTKRERGKEEERKRRGGGNQGRKTD
jgi:hypothetical protein